MEENITNEDPSNEQIVGDTQTDEQTANAAGASPNELKKEELQEALKETILDLEKLCEGNTGQITLISIINILLIIGAYCFGKTLYENTQFEKYWDLRIIYYTSTRILLVSAYISLVVFMLNLLKNYLINARLNRDKLLIARSMSGLLAAGSGFIERNKVYDKLLEIIISNNSKSSLEKTDESMKIASYDTIVDLVKKAMSGK